jgi:hypothetical protein
MKLLTILSLVAAQLLTVAQPAMAAELIDEKGAASQRHGAFAGARLRVPLGGESDRKLRAGLTVAPIAEGTTGEGSRRVRFGEGLELGIAGGSDRPALAFAGRPVSQIAQGPVAPDGPRHGTSTGKGLLIVGGIVILTLGAVALLLVSQE